MSETSQPAPAPAARQEPIAPARGASPALSWVLLLLALLLWLLASIAGTLGESLQRFPREVSFSRDSEPVNFCYLINPEAVDEQPELRNAWCTSTEVLGTTLPPDVSSHVGSVQWESVSWGDVVEALGQPSLWLTVGVGGSALLFFVVFAQATGTIRAGLAAAVSVVFLGLLLFPAAFTARIPHDMRAELVEAWKWVILFYFGSEAAVQAAKIMKPGSADVTGDLTAGSASRILPALRRKSSTGS